MSKVKVRFAPSPTGPLHIGGARSALFNYLFAKREGGRFLVRIEDTDLERSRPEYERDIVDSLSWLGINWDEGIEVGGENGPYRQTERLDTYHRYADYLLRNGLAYHCFCSEEELEEERKSQLGQHVMAKYSGKCRYLTWQEKEEKLKKGIVPTVRFRVPEGRVVVINDLVRGEVVFDTSNIGDFIIVKSDGIPTYNFAVVVDDHEMRVTHVIRAEEHLPNTPRQVLLYEALNLNPPQFAHISLILGQDRQKMSKRHGATSVVQYREMGYLPEAMFNFLALLGWSPEGENEILSPQEIIEKFSLDRVAKNPAVFDIDKLNWINSQHIKRKTNHELVKLLMPFIRKSRYYDKLADWNEQKLLILAEAVRERLVRLSDLEEEIKLFVGPLELEEEAKKVLEEEGTRDTLAQVVNLLPDISNVEEAAAFIKRLPKELKVPAKKVLMPLRCAVTGKTKGPDLPYIMALMGTEELMKRIRQFLGQR